MGILEQIGLSFILSSGHTEIEFLCVWVGVWVCGCVRECEGFGMNRLEEEKFVHAWKDRFNKAFLFLVYKFVEMTKHMCAY